MLTYIYKIPDLEIIHMHSKKKKGCSIFTDFCHAISVQTKRPRYSELGVGSGSRGGYPGSERYWWTMCPLWLPPLSARSDKLGRSLAEETMRRQRSEGNGGRWQDRGVLKKFPYQLEVVTVLVSAVVKHSD